MLACSGYFEAHLYGDIGLSIHPDRMHLVSPEMLSWFPLFFPFKVSLEPQLPLLNISSADPISPLAIRRSLSSSHPTLNSTSTSGV